MRVLLQRVASASLAVDDRVVTAIASGLVLMTGFGADDDASVLGPMVDKVRGLRVFEDSAGRFQYSLDETGGDVLVVPQFTLYGDTRRGRRPDFVQALAPAAAEPLFDAFADELERRATAGCVARGVFGAHMAVHLINDGPVTLMLERQPRPAPG